MLNPHHFILEPESITGTETEVVWSTETEVGIYTTDKNEHRFWLHILKHVLIQKINIKPEFIEKEYLFEIIKPGICGVSFRWC